MNRKDREGATKLAKYFFANFATSLRSPRLKAFPGSVAPKRVLYNVSRARNQTISADGVRKSCGLSVQAESGGAGHGAWEISPATGPQRASRLRSCRRRRRVSTHA